MTELEINKKSTQRATVEELEQYMFRPIRVLDHGFVRLVDYMGDDSSIVQAARVSYGRGTKTSNQDQGLINYLMRNKHTTPFEMCELKLHVKMPIFIARQWIRHRTASINEYSARYSIMSKEFYIPNLENLGSQSSVKKQCRTGNDLAPAEAQTVLDMLREDATRCYNNYQKLMNVGDNDEIIDPSKTGLARELARMNLTMNLYTEFYWKIDLHNLFHFLRLRSHGHSQYEIRVYADEILEMVKVWVPMAYSAFETYNLNSINLSSKAVSVVKGWIRGESISQENSGMSKNEWDEFIAEFNGSH